MNDADVLKVLLHDSRKVSSWQGNIKKAQYACGNLIMISLLERVKIAAGREIAQKYYLRPIEDVQSRASARRRPHAAARGVVVEYMDRAC